MLLCLCLGVKESDTGLAHPGMWDLFSDKMSITSEQPLQVSGCGCDSMICKCGKAQLAATMIDAEAFFKLYLNCNTVSA